jgi:hypothetical protein
MDSTRAFGWSGVIFRSNPSTARVLAWSIEKDVLWREVLIEDRPASRYGLRP